MVMKNQIPKSYLPYDLYNNLIPNEDPDAVYYQQVPRTGSFEVSYKGNLIFSKLKGGCWPNIEVLSEKAIKIIDADDNGYDITPYLAGNAPLKGGGYGPSPKKARHNRSKMEGVSPTR